MLPFCPWRRDAHGPAQTPGHASLPGHVIRALANATRLPHTRQMDEEPITVTVVLNLSGGRRSLMSLNVVITAAEANLTAAVPGRFIGDARPVIAGSIAPQELTWSLFRRNVCNSFRVNGVGMAPTLWAQ